MSKDVSLYDLNENELVENKQSGKKVTAGVLKGYIARGKKNQYDGEWYVVDIRSKGFNIFGDLKEG